MNAQNIIELVIYGLKMATNHWKQKKERKKKGNDPELYGHSIKSNQIWVLKGKGNPDSDWIWVPEY